MKILNIAKNILMACLFLVAQKTLAANACVPSMTDSANLCFQLPPNQPSIIELVLKWIGPVFLILIGLIIIPVLDIFGMLSKGV